MEKFMDEPAGPGSVDRHHFNLQGSNLVVFGATFGMTDSFI